MSDAILLANIERLMKPKGFTADSLAAAAGKKDSIRNLRRRVRGEKTGSWKIDTLEAVARALEVPAWELLRPQGAVPTDQELEERVNRILDQRLSQPNPAPKRKLR